MSEKTLQEVGEEAAKHYREHELGVIGTKTAEEQLSLVNAPGWHSHKTTREVAQAGAQKWVDIEKRYDVRAIEGSAEFAKTNADQLHDLAVIEAHIGGIAINVEQPVEVGQKIEVRTPNQQ